MLTELFSLSLVSRTLALFAQGEGGGLFGPGCVQMLPAFILIFVLMYFMIIRPQQRERQRHAQMLTELKKNDRVVTIGGIIGTVASVTSESPEVTIKVDETTNTKLVILKSAIHQVFREKDEAPKELPTK